MAEQSIDSHDIRIIEMNPDQYNQQQLDAYDREHAPDMRKQQAERLKRQRLKQETEHELRNRRPASREQAMSNSGHYH
jgi:hypothetical protein